MQEAKFKLGDVVKLKSGGPDMTVIQSQEPISSGDVWWYNVKYFDPFNGQLIPKKTFQEYELELVKSE